jgi:hypothetical protein
MVLSLALGGGSALVRKPLSAREQQRHQKRGMAYCDHRGDAIFFDGLDEVGGYGKHGSPSVAFHRWLFSCLFLAAKFLSGNGAKGCGSFDCRWVIYGVEIRPLLVTTIHRLPQRTIDSILPTPGTRSPRFTLRIPFEPSRIATPSAMS